MLPSPVFHQRRVQVMEGFARTRDIKLWDHNERIDIHLAQFRKEQGRGPTSDELFSILSGALKLPGVAGEDEFKVKDLARSIAANGVRRPPIIDDDGTLLDGNRRVAACLFILESDDYTAEEKGRAERIVVWQLRSLTKTKEEPLHGADLVMVLDIELGDYSVRKGLLAQAKRLEPGTKMDADEWRRLRGQCERMLEVTSESVVLLYHKGGVTPISATAVLAYQERDLFSIHTWPIEILYSDFAMCWKGDPHIEATDPASLEALRLVADARAAVRFVGRGRAERSAAADVAARPPRGRRLNLDD